jgi:hypothetical protein
MTIEIPSVVEDGALTPEVLITQIVRQTMVLVGQLATSTGLRASLSAVADQVFLDLVEVLEGQRVPKKVAASMFGMALRGYQAKIVRLQQSKTERGVTAWQAILDYLQARPEGALVTDVVAHFEKDGERLVRAVVNDLVERGHAMRSGVGERAMVQATEDDQLVPFTAPPEERLARMACHIVYREGPLTAGGVAERLKLDAGLVGDALDQLVVDGVVECLEEDGHEPLYRCYAFNLDYGDPVGWEAAVADHYRAVVGAISTKLVRGRFEADRGDTIGGSTYHLDVWPGHPYYERAKGLLSKTRTRLSELRAEIAAYNEKSGYPDEYERVIFYCGQGVTREES